MEFRTNISYIEEAFKPWKEKIGPDYQGYRNHVYRMFHFCLALKPGYTDCEEEKFMTAAVFHDIGIWIEDTVDYISPSLPPAKAFLEEKGKLDYWPEVELMISEHHKITRYKNLDFPLVEIFRKADQVDFSLGLLRNGIKRSFIKKVQSKLANEGFHKSLLKRAAKWFLKHPLNPVPMMKW